MILRLFQIAVCLVMIGLSIAVYRGADAAMEYAGEMFTAGFLAGFCTLLLIFFIAHRIDSHSGH